jgi:hypothetical protein
MPKATNVADFWARLEAGLTQPHMTTPCRLWSGCVSKAGYGLVSACRLPHVPQHSRRPQLTHRVAWALHADMPVPAGENVLHACDTPRCCNPEHLYLGSHRQNAVDREVRGRGAHHLKRGRLNGRYTHPETTARGDRNGARTCPEALLRGAAHPNARLSEDAVREIRRRRASGVTLAVIAAEFGVSMVLVSLIYRRKAWRHVADEPEAG